MARRRSPVQQRGQRRDHGASGAGQDQPQRGTGGGGESLVRHRYQPADQSTARVVGEANGEKMTNYRELEQQLSSDLGLMRRPIAIAIREAPPPGVAKFEGTAPSGCSFWRMASEGRTFFTVPSDHYNCAIGSYTHNIPLPAERAKELEETLGLMADIGYVRMEEVPGIPVLPKTPGAVVYAPLGDTPVEPDVVLFSGPASRVMLLQEAATRAGVASSLNTLGRPTCMALPAALAHGMVASTGCVGNRVYTAVGEGDLYAAVPGRDLARLADTTATISGANAKLLEYHQARRHQLSAQWHV